MKSCSLTVELPLILFVLSYYEVVRMCSVAVKCIDITQNTDCEGSLLRFHASVSGTSQYAAFAYGVPHDINGFYPYTVSSAYLLRPLAIPFRSAFLRLSRRISRTTNIATYASFTPSDSG